jgi:hypothetical protein
MQSARYLEISALTADLRLSCAKNDGEEIQLVSWIPELFVHGTGDLLTGRAFDWDN